MSVRTLDLDQNSLTIWQNNWSASNVGYVGKIIHNGEPNQPYPGGFSAMFGELKQRLPKVTWATYLSMSYLQDLEPGFPRRSIPKEFFYDDEVNGNILNFESSEARRKWIGLACAEMQWRLDMFGPQEIWFDDYPTPFDPNRLDFYVSWMAEVNAAMLKLGVRTRLNASNLFYASKDDGALITLAKSCGGSCLEGPGIDEELKDPARLNRRLITLTQYHNGVEICPPTQDQAAALAWTTAAAKTLKPALATGKVFLAYSHMWAAPPWA